jgi:excisionase family DNA binding protein
VTESEIHNGCHATTDPAGLGDGSSQAPELVKHLALALSRHVRDLRQAGVSVPAEVDELAAFLARSVRLRQATTAVDEDLDAVQAPRVMDRLLLTKGEAAEQLGVSVRTIERLVAAGQLPLVHIESAARFRVSDLEAYVHDLPEGQGSQSGADDPR